MSVALDECATRSHLKLCQCGICVFNHTPYLACSPDGLNWLMVIALARSKAHTLHMTSRCDLLNVLYLDQHADRAMSLDRHHNYYCQCAARAEERTAGDEIC